MIATLAHWEEWRNAAVLFACTEETRQALQTFAWQRWQKYLRAAVGEGGPERGELEPAQVWLLFETHCLLNAPSTHSCFKEWLFHRLNTHEGKPLDIVQSGASLLM